MKDRFSDAAKQYAQFRPTYPAALIAFVLQHVSAFNCAWDVGTGNGQVAAVLSAKFTTVEATDISAKQMDEAPVIGNVHYQILPAEKTNFSDQQFDLITVAQAIHWFHFNEFYAEVNRTLKPGGVIAVWGYGLIETAGSLNDILANLYYGLDQYWDAERKHIDEAYQKIPFLFKEINEQTFAIEVNWKIEELIGYFSTWSAVGHYKKQHEEDPVKKYISIIKENWGEEITRKFQFPVFLKLGKK